ncbi:MAG: hypothetical protein IAG10_26825 [Planctomycetaceae bacterium]|nr:hypothetical protein [Planctomycetaceae bacterium]
MAIQFNCPYCTVTIQVPDQAAGKKGTCPQCGTKVVVPMPKNAPPVEAAPAPPAFVPPPPPAPVFAPNAVPQQMPFAPQPTMPFPGYSPAPGMPFGFDPNQPQAAPQGYPGPAGFAPMPTFVPAPLAPTQEEPPSVAKKYKRKLKRRGGPAVWGPLVAVVVIVAGLAFYYMKPGAKPDLLSGKLTGTRLAKGKLEPALVHREWVDGIDEETLANVLKQMEKRTVKFRSSNDLISMTFQGSPEGLKVLATAGPSAELIAVDLSSNKALDKWHQKHAAKLSDQCQKNVARSAKKFVQEWAQAEATRDTNHSFGHFHDELGLAALTMGLGAEVVAIVGKTMHGCVAQQQGMLYFLLPAGTDRFELQGREHGKNNVVFPGHFVVNVESAAPVRKPTQKKTDDEPEMTEDGEGDMKTKSFGKPALNDPSAVDESMPEKPKSKKKETKNDD